MSCMMTNTKELTTLAAYVAAILEGADEMGTIEGVKRIDPPKSLAKALDGCRVAKGMWNMGSIYCRLYKLNESAYCGRYGEKPVKVIPPMVGADNEINTKDDDFKEWATRLWYLLRFYNYQCAEDATRGEGLHYALCELQSTLAECVAKCVATEELCCVWGYFGK